MRESIFPTPSQKHRTERWLKPSALNHISQDRMERIVWRRRVKIASQLMDDDVQARCIWYNSHERHWIARTFLKQLNAKINIAFGLNQLKITRRNTVTKLFQATSETYQKRLYICTGAASYTPTCMFTWRLYNKHTDRCAQEYVPQGLWSQPLSTTYCRMDIFHGYIEQRGMMGSMRPQITFSALHASLLLSFSFQKW